MQVYVGFVPALVQVLTQARRKSLEFELRFTVSYSPWMLGSELLALSKSLFPSVWETFCSGYILAIKPDQDDDTEIVIRNIGYNYKKIIFFLFMRTVYLKLIFLLLP